MNSLSNERWRGLLATVLQIFYWPALWFLAHIVCQCEVVDHLGDTPLENHHRYIIAANHQSRLDPFVISGVLRPRFWRILLPYRYITANQYLYNPLLFLLLWPLGGFPVNSSTIEANGLVRAENIMDRGQTVGIFPEGQRQLPTESVPKRGVAVLANRPDTRVIPIKMAWVRQPRRVRIIIGQPFNAAGLDEYAIMHHIYDLQ